MVWFALATVKLCPTCGAGLKLPSPDWSATRVQVPAATIVAEFPLSVQTDGVVDAKATVKPDDAVAVMAKGESP